MMNRLEIKDYRRGFNEGLSDGMKLQKKPFKYFNRLQEQGYNDGYNCAIRSGGRNPYRFMRFRPPMVIRPKLTKTIA